MKDNYIIIKSAVQKDLCYFLYNYLLIKKQVAETMFNTNYISPFNKDWGYWNDLQVPNTYSIYGDVAMETLLLKMQPLMEKKIKEKITPTYSYARVYKKGDILKRHKDRFSCEISTTLNLGGDPWPIYLEPSGKEGKKGIKVNLKPGDMLIYKGCDLEHWREPFKGKDCVQVFLHYNLSSKKGDKNLFDKRPHVGLPSSFKK